MQKTWDVIVIGAGPAGLACAAATAEQGLSVIVLDEQAAPGGQIYRNIEQQKPKLRELFGKDSTDGASLVERFRKSDAAYLPQSRVWNIEPDGRVSYSLASCSTEIKGKRVVIATGAMERPAPFPGWTLPGVMACGGVDSLLKSDGLLPDGPITMAGSGPIMLVVAKHLHALGVKIAGIYDTTPSSSLLQAMPHLPRALRRTGYLLQGVGMLASTTFRTATFQRNVTGYRANGTDRVESLTVERNNKHSTHPVSTLLVHEGIIPRTEFSRQLRLAHCWDPVQRCWHPQVDGHGRTSAPAIYIAGDSAFVHGAVAAAQKGELAALAIIDELSPTPATRDRRTHCQHMLSHALAPRPFIDALYQPRPSLYDVADETIVCRCEEVTAGTIRLLARTGSDSPEKVKSLTRAGMGPCQGRMCSCGVAELIAQETGTLLDTHLPLSVRPPVRNIGLAELATMSLYTDDNSGEKNR